MVAGQRKPFFADEERKLIAFATPRIREAVGGINESKHIAAAKAFGVKLGHNGGPALDEDPGMFMHVWSWFLELCETRQIEGMSGLHQPIPNREILAWSELNQQPIAAHEYRLLRAMDRIFIREERLAKAEKAKQEAATKDQRRR